jgi:hypothetical protein
MQGLVNLIPGDKQVGKLSMINNSLPIDAVFPQYGNNNAARLNAPQAYGQWLESLVH